MAVQTVRTETTLLVAPWLARKLGLASRELSGEVKRTTEKAVLVRAHAIARPSDTCLRCGRMIENPVSRLVGYGPWCSDELGIPRNFTEEQLDEVRARVAEVVFEGWLPRSGVTLTEGALPEPSAPEGEGVTTRLTVERDRLVARTPFGAKDVCKSIPGARWNEPVEKAWQWSVSETTAAEVIAKLSICAAAGTLDVADEFAALAAEAQAGVDKARAFKVDLDDDDLDPVPVIPLNPDAPPRWHHQVRAFWLARARRAFAFPVGMGGGKSRIAVDLLCDADARRVLILCPNNVVGVWPKQLRLYGDRTFDVHAPRKGTVAKKAQELARVLATHTDEHDPLVVILNYEAAWRTDLAAVLLGQVWDYVVLDESHRIKAPGGKASRFVQKLGRVAQHRLALSGTLMPHSPLDVYGQYRFLDPGIFGTSFVRFRSRYAVMGGYGGHEILSYQREAELSERLHSIAYEVTQDSLDAILGLEEPLHEVRTCTLSPPARKVYDEFHRNMVVAIKKGEVVATNALVKLLRLQQMTSGHVPVEEVNDEGALDRTVVEVDTAKRDALADLLEDVDPDEPVVVFCRFVHDLDAVEHVARKLGRTYRELSARRRDALTEDSTLAPDARVAAIQIQSGGEGVDFSRAHYCVLYSIGFSLAQYDQALKRTHRPGQRHRVTYYHLVAEGTVDEHVYAALQERRDVVEYVMGLARE